MSIQFDLNDLQAFAAAAERLYELLTDLRPGRRKAGGRAAKAG